VIQLSTDDVTFSSGSGILTDEGRAALDSLVPALTAIDNTIEIDGHTDDTGSYDLNWDLSGARAAAAVKYLQNAHGIAPERLHYAGFGETDPIAGNDSAEGQRANRRVEVVIVVDPSAATGAVGSGSGSGTGATSGTADPGATPSTAPTAAPADPRATPSTTAATSTTPTTRPVTPTTTAGTGAGASTATGPRASTGVVIQPGSLARQASGA
jgi:hypothetical protein